jgi:hypothetical protein
MTRTFVAAATAVITSLVFVGATAQDATTSAAPESEAAGRKLVQTICGSCHAASSILGEHRTRHDWEEILEWMADEGAVMSDEEYEQMMAFLGVRYGLVAVNTASTEDIQTVLELTDDQAQRLDAARKAGARFRTLDDLARTTGIPAASLAERQDRIDFSAE